MRILRVLTRPNLGGPMRQAVALWHAHARIGLRTLLCVGRCGDDEQAVAMEESGLPQQSFEAAVRGGPEAIGICELPFLGRSVSPWRDFRAASGLRRLIAATRPDVVHTHTSKAGVLGRLAARAGQVPVVAHTFHGIVLRDYATRALSGLARGAERFLASRSDLLFAVSESCRKELRSLGVARDVTVLPPAVPTALFAAADRAAARRSLGVSPDQVVLGFVGRLASIKQPEHFLALIGALPENYVGCVLGDGPKRSALMANAGPRVRFLGSLQEPAPLVAGFDLLVLCSRREGFPVAGVEAAAAGVPTVGYDVPGVRDLVTATGQDLLVPPDAGVEGLVARVLAACENQPPRILESGAALAQRCDPDSVARSLAAAYGEAAMEAAS